VIQPTSNRVLVELIDPPPTAAGLVLPMPAYGIRSSQEQRGHRGRVVAVGPGKRTRKGVLLKPTVKPGDVVRFGEFDFKRFRPENGVVRMLISEMDICGVEEP
jgi:chaperonin GroES